MSQPEEAANEEIVAEVNNDPPAEPEFIAKENIDGEHKDSNINPPAEDEIVGDNVERESAKVEATRKDSLEDDRENIPESIMTQNSHVEPIGKVPSTRGFKVRPDLSEKFRPGVVQLLIEKTIKELLQDQVYSVEDAPQWTKTITNEIHRKVKILDYKRYKLVTFVVLGEYRGGGISVSNRCLWDADSDCKATYKFLNESLFCVGTVYGFYFY